MNFKFIAPFIILFLSNLNVVLSQNSRFGFTLNSGAGIYSFELESNESIKQSLIPILNIGLIYEFHYTEKYTTEIALGANFTKRKYEYKFVGVQNQQTNASELILNKNHNATYLNGLINWGYQNKGLKFKLGFQTILFISIKDKDSYYVFSNSNGSSLIPYDIGTDEGLSFLFVELFSEIGMYLTESSELKICYFLGIGKKSHRDFAPKQRISFGLTKYF